MSDKDLESFKIGDSHQPGISSPVSAKGAREGEGKSSPSLGFARIEKILENETPDSVGAKLTHLISELESFENQADTSKDKLAAQKAVGAIERVADLMNYLFETKTHLEANSE